MGKAARIARNPGKYLGIARKRALGSAAKLLSRASFRLQGQMDIHPVSLWHVSEFTSRFGGFLLPHDTVRRQIVDLEPWDSVRRDMLVLLLRSIIERGVSGDIAELGVYKGYTAKLFHYYAPERVLHLFDTFGGFDDVDLKEEVRVTGKVDSPSHFADTSLTAVMDYLSPQNENVKIYQGLFPKSVPTELCHRRYCLVHLDADLYLPIIEGLRYFYSRVTPGGFIVVHDFNAWPGARVAVNEFFSDKPEIPLPMPDKSGSAVMVKSSY
ncbi:MAG: TylF/MycF/NovP-related O-methyltransferase [Bryobacteraceae bacterium]|jgi:O-methyltransferase